MPPLLGHRVSIVGLTKLGLLGLLAPGHQRDVVMLQWSGMKVSTRCGEMVYMQQR